MKYAEWFSTLLKNVGGLSLLGMMLLTCSDVIGSFVGYPILGVEELVALWASILLAFALPAAHIAKANVGVDLLHRKFPRRMRKMNDIAVTVISCTLFLLITWQCYVYANELRAAGEVTMTLQFPAYILIYGVAFAFLIKSIVILFELLVTLKSEK